MVTTANPYSDEQVLEMQAHARQPLVAITGVFLAFFLPPAIVAAILVVVSIAHLELTTQLVLLALAFAVAPPAISMLRTLRQSDRRNTILSDLAKFQEHLRESAEAVVSSDRTGESQP